VVGTRRRKLSHFCFAKIIGGLPRLKSKEAALGFFFTLTTAVCDLIRLPEASQSIGRAKTERDPAPHHDPGSNAASLGYRVYLPTRGAITVLPGGHAQLGQPSSVVSRTVDAAAVDDAITMIPIM
jgi:hypothetical protein